MSYYFPSFLSDAKLPGKVSKDLVCTTNTGKNALRLLFRSFKMPAGSKIAIPAFVCPAVKEAVLAEGFEPVLLDLKDDRTFWTDHNPEELKGNVKAIVLTHLYGFIHPDTNAIVSFCKENGIHLVHDAAQSYGIDEAELGKNALLVYSFGPGKSTTAAGGGWIKGINENIYKESISLKYTAADEWRSELFLKSRIYGYELNFADKIKKKVAGPAKGKKQIYAMSPFQRRAATLALSGLSKAAIQRRSNYSILSSAVEKSNGLFIPYNDKKGLCFKLIAGVKNNPAQFAAYLEKNQVPFFRLFDEKESQNYSLPNFSQNANTFFEISCEASLPQAEIARVAGILAYY